MNAKLTVTYLMPLIISSALFLEAEVSRFKIIREFPSQAQMDKGGFVFHQPHRFCVVEDLLFVCDQRAHKIFKMDLKGNLINSIGSHGQGPGEFHLPLTVIVNNRILFVGDNGNSRIQVFNLDGKLEKVIKMINPINDFVVIDGEIFNLMNRTISFEDEKPAIFGILNMDGEMIKKTSESFQSDYRDRRFDNRVRLRVINRNEIHALQMYGTTYRIYNTNGDKIKEIELQIDPLDNKKYRKMKYLYTYTSFDTCDGKIYACKVAKGRIEIYIFDMMGCFLYKRVIRGNDKKIYHVNDMRIVEVDGKKMLYLLMWTPEVSFKVIEVDDLLT